MANTTITHVPNPYVHISATPGIQISSADALSQIQTYLDQSKTSPHLHPDALFTESGLAYAGSASTGGVILHQLRRVEQGLQGVWLGIDPEADEALDKLEGIKTELDGVVENIGPAGDYQQQLREQGEGDISGEVDKRNNAVGNVDFAEPVVATSGKKRGYAEMNGDGEVEAVAETPVKDKEARKKAKKERRKAEKKDRHAQTETPTRNKQSSLINEPSQLNEESGESQVQVKSSQSEVNGRSSQVDNIDDGSPTKQKVQLSASPDQYSSGQTQQLRGEALSPPSSAPKTNGHAISDAEANANGLNALPLANGILKDDNADQTENAQDKARRKAEKRARKEEKRRKKEEKLKAKEAEH